jgi:hypothetical protein
MTIRHTIGRAGGEALAAASLQEKRGAGFRPLLELFSTGRLQMPEHHRA